MSDTRSRKYPKAGSRFDSGKYPQPENCPDPGNLSDPGNHIEAGNSFESGNHIESGNSFEFGNHFGVGSSFKSGNHLKAGKSRSGRGRLLCAFFAACVLLVGLTGCKKSTSGDASSKTAPKASSGAASKASSGASAEKAGRGAAEGTALTQEDLFAPDGVIVEFMGTSPDAYAVIRNVSEDPYLSNISYYADREKPLATGDMVTVRADLHPMEAYIDGYIVSEDALSRQYEVKGVDRYITSMDEINEDTWEVIGAQTMDIIDSWIAKKEQENNLYDPESYVNYYKHGEPEGVSNLFLTLKEGLNDREYSFDDRDNNRLCQVYRAHQIHESTISSHVYEENDLHFAVVYENIILKADGGIEVVVTDAVLLQDYNVHTSYEEVCREFLEANRDYYVGSEKRM